MLLFLFRHHSLFFCLTVHTHCSSFKAQLKCHTLGKAILNWVSLKGCGSFPLRSHNTLLILTTALATWYSNDLYIPLNCWHLKDSHTVLFLYYQNLEQCPVPWQREYKHDLGLDSTISGTCYLLLGT